MAKGNGHDKKGLRLYRSYNFRDKDPVIDRIRTIVQDEGLKYKDIERLSSVKAQTLTNWFEGETKRPQYATIAAVTSALGYKTDFVKAKEINYEREIAKARREIEAAQEKVGR